MSPAEQKLHLIMQHAPMGLIEIEENGKILGINRIACNLLNPLSSEDLTTGSNLLSCLISIDPGMSDQIQNFAEPAGPIVLNQQYSLSYPTGWQKHFQFTITKIYKDCLIVAIDDLTEKVQEEQVLKLAQQDKAVAQGKYEIASEVIHDIGNAVVGFGSYLTRINRMLEQYSHGNLQKVAAFLKQQQEPIGNAIGTPKAVALVDMMEAISKSLSDSQDELQRSVTEQLQIVTHIQDILNIQRQYVTGHESQERKPVNLKDIINDCRSMVFANMEKKGISLSLSVPRTPIEIKGDRTKLMQVLLNILKNSIEAIDMDGAERTISIGLEDTSTKVALTITDTGKGFSEEVAVHLFDRGYTTKSTGTGLGLYNCKTIIESHAGRIAIQSNGINKGSKTTIEFNKLAGG
jgi:signal transduction histidine kinase